MENDEAINTSEPQLIKVDIISSAPPGMEEYVISSAPPVIEEDVISSAPPGIEDDDMKNVENNLSVIPFPSNMNFPEIANMEQSEKLSNEERDISVNVDKVGFDNLDEGIPDENDIYNRFYFESDHLALKDNTDYQLLLQTLVALEAQQKQAVKDYEKLIKMRTDALTKPIEFVEKLQNNEPLGIPVRQNIIKVPQINWENYSGAIHDDLSQLSLLHQHNTRHSAPGYEKANQRWEEQSTTSNGSFAESSQESFRVDTSRYVRGKLATNDKTLTFNQPWTSEEQRKLERLLHVYPQETVESKRWSKIANALGNRTPKQVASRVQKYFIKLAKSGLPIPGRFPNLNKILTKVPRNTPQQQQVFSFRNSTFFPSYQPRVYMEDDDTFDDLDEISDDESIPEALRNTKEYLELLQIKRLKRAGQQMKNPEGPEHHGFMINPEGPEHHGFMCDSCGMSPIVGVRWHCLDCPTTSSTDICQRCIQKKDHDRDHQLEPIDWVDFIDGDYLKLGESSKGYNYLDPNFLPAAT